MCITTNWRHVLWCNRSYKSAANAAGDKNIWGLLPLGYHNIWFGKLHFGSCPKNHPHRLEEIRVVRLGKCTCNKKSVKLLKSAGHVMHQQV